MTKDGIPSLSTVQEHHIGKDFYNLPVTPDSEYIVDDSCFIPMFEAVKQLGLNPNFTGSDQKTMYDFPDGKDSGVEIPINRTKNGKDIAELSTSVYEANEKVVSELQKQKDFEEYKQKVNERMNNMKSNQDS